MSNTQIITIPRMPDRSVIECFKGLGEKYNVSKFNLSALGSTNLGEIDLLETENETYNLLVTLDSTLIFTCSMQIAGLHIRYYRGGNVSGKPEEKSAIYDEISLIWNDKPGNLKDTDKLEIIAFITHNLKAFEPGRFIDTGLSKEQNQLLSIHESTLERLENLNEELIKQSADFRKKLEKQFDDKNTELEKQTSNKQEKLVAEHEKQKITLAEQEQKLTEKLDAIDDRDNTHVRREIRDKMLSDVKARIEQFGVSQSTEKKRRPVFAGIVTMAVVIISMLVFSIFQISSTLSSSASSSGIVIILLFLKLTILTIGLLGTVLFYVRWQNKWAEQHANSEFQLQQFYIDVNRANWVIESCLEWHKEANSVIPTALVNSMTKNLFNNSDEELEKVIHPSDELASALLGSASKLKMKIGDSELDFNKPGKIKPKISSQS